MAFPNIFDLTVSQQIIQRIEKLKPTHTPLWGKMNPAQMMAHCNVTYEMIYTDKHKKPNFIVKWMLTSFVKSKVVGETPYIKNGPTGPQFLVRDEKNFDNEKKTLIEYIQKTQSLGRNYFEQLPSHSFGPLTADEWNNMLYKHLDHHLRQFGV